MGDVLATVPMPPRIAALPRTARGYPIPYVAAWSDEKRYTVRSVAGYPACALFTTGRVGVGEPLLGEMDMVRQREVFATKRCQVCRAWLPRLGAWWMAMLLEDTVDGPMIREPWACVSCLAYSLRVCPGLLGVAHRGAKHGSPPLLVLRVAAFQLVATMTSLVGLARDGSLDPSVPQPREGDVAVGYFKLIPTRFERMTVADFLDATARAALRDVPERGR